MARPRKQESTYERRIRRYLETHPGATRQQARGHRLPAGVRSEYQRRVAGTAAGSPERQIAAGKRRVLLAGQKTRLLSYIQPGDVVMLGKHISQYKRNRDGLWVNVDLTVRPEFGDRPMRVFTLSLVTDAELQRLVGQTSDAGAIINLIPSLDVSRLAR